MDFRLKTVSNLQTATDGLCELFLLLPLTPHRTDSMDDVAAGQVACTEYMRARYV